jgi:HEPN domain-containing protein
MKPHEEWLFKAEHDIKSAELLLQSVDPLYDIIVYHTQQCAEKALKAFLTSHLKEIDKSHNLILLVEKCIQETAKFDTIYDDCIFLNPYATLYRYPEGDLMPEMSEVNKSIESARKILHFVNALL